MITALPVTASVSDSVTAVLPDVVVSDDTVVVVVNTRASIISVLSGASVNVKVLPLTL